MSDLSPTLHMALKAIDSGRIPAEESILAKLKRKGLIARNVLSTGWHLTDAGRDAIGQWR